MAPPPLPPWAERWAGTPFVPFGRDRAGADCWGLVRGVLGEEHGVDLPLYLDRYTSPSDVRSVEHLVADARPSWAEVPAGEEQEGDVVLLRVRGRPCHVGVVAAPGWMLHVTQGIDATIEEYRGPRWERRVLGFYRPAEVTAEGAVVSGSAGTLRVLGLPHPFAQRRVDLTVPEGASLAELVRHALPSADPALCVAHVDGQHVPRSAWGYSRPQAGQLVTVQAVPAGGGSGTAASAERSDPNKNERTMMTLAVITATILIGNAAALGMYAPYVAAAVAVGGAYAINTLAPPPKPDTGRSIDASRTSPTLSVTGTANRANPYGVVPRVLGKHRLFPPLAAKPYVEIEGEDQYVNLLYDCGYGPLALYDLKIGETPLANFGSESTDAPRSVTCTVWQGYPTDGPMEIFRQTADTQSVTTLLASGVEHVFQTGADADEIHLDLSFAGLVRLDESGAKQPTFVDLDVAYRKLGQPDWTSERVLPGDAAAASSGVTKADEYVEGDWTFQVWRTNQAVMADFLRFNLVYQGSYIDSLNPSRGINVRGGLMLRARVLGATKWTPYWMPTGKGYIDPDLDHVRQPFVVPAAQGQRIEILFGWKTVHPASIDSWSYQAPAAQQNLLRYTDARDALVRRSIHIVPGERAAYEVKIKRLTLDSTDWHVRDECTLAAVVSITYAEPTRVLGKHALVELRLRATDQLQGMLDQFNCVAASILPVWDGAAWVEEETANPAWCYCEVLRGAANRRPLAESRLHLSDLAAWAADCSLHGREFNAVLDFSGTVFETLRSICSAGRASFGMRDGLYTVVRDVAQSVPVQHFTPRNSWGFSGERTFSPELHGLRVLFVNREKWAEDERIVYADGYDEANATVIEDLRLFGVTDAAQAWQDGRYHLAVGKLRREAFHLTTDVEHLVCTRGDLVRAMNDVILVGLGAGRIKSLTVDGQGRALTITLDEIVAQEEGKTYGIRVRRANFASQVALLSTEEGESATLTLAAPLADPPAEGDLVLFGEAGTESMECLVQAIEPRADLSATLTLIPAAPAVHEADAGEIPPYNPLITLPPELNRPAPPMPTLGAASVRQDTAVDGTSVLTVSVPVSMPGLSAGVAVRHLLGQCRETSESAWSAAIVQAGSSTVFVFANVVGGRTYDLRVRAVGENGLASPWATTSVLVAHDTIAPAPPSGFEVALDGWVIKCRWLGATESDWSHYLVSVDDWLTSRRIERPAIDLNLPSARQTVIRVKSVDRSGNASAESSTVAYLAAPPAPPASGLVIAAEYNVVTLSVDPDQARTIGGRGYVYRWTVNGGATWWDALALGTQTPGGETVTFAVPLVLFAAASLTLGCQYAETDLFGPGPWSETAEATIYRQPVDDGVEISPDADPDLAGMASAGFLRPNDGDTPGTGWRLNYDSFEGYGGATGFKAAFGGPLYSSDGSYLTTVGVLLTTTGQTKRFPRFNSTNFTADGQTHWYRWTGTAWQELGSVGLSTSGPDSLIVNAGSLSDTGALGAAIGVYGKSRTAYGVAGLSQLGTGVVGSGTGAGSIGVQGSGEFLSISAGYIAFTPIGGLAIRVAAAEALAEGEIVTWTRAGDSNHGALRVKKVPLAGDEQNMPIGAVYRAADTLADVWVVVSGLAYVLPVAGVTPTQGYAVYLSATTAGRVAQSSAEPAADTWRMVGHWANTAGGAGVATLCALHFN